MTERFGALAALVQSTSPARTAALQAFHDRHRDDALVLDKWFALQAGAWSWDDAAEPALARVRVLLSDPAVQPVEPEQGVRAAGHLLPRQPGEFHAADGSGHAFWAEQVIALDAKNPQVAARMARALGEPAPVHPRRCRPASARNSNACSPRRACPRTSPRSSARRWEKSGRAARFAPAGSHCVPSVIASGVVGFP